MYSVVISCGASDALKILFLLLNYLDKKLLFFHTGVGVESKQRFSALLISSVLIIGFQAVFENQFRDAQPVDIAAGKGYSSNTTA